MGAENSKGKGTAENFLPNDVTSEDLQNLQDFHPETDEAEILNLALDEAGNTSDNGIVVNGTKLDCKNGNPTEEGTGVEEERVIEIDEYTRKLTIIQENVYHYVGLMSGSEYAREMGIEVEKNSIPQAPIEFLLQRKTRQKVPLSSSQPDHKAFENENSEVNVRSLEQPDDEKSLGQDIANDRKAMNSCEEKFIKEDESGIIEKDAADEIGVRSQILEKETLTEPIASTVESNGNYSGETELNGEKDKASEKESMKITNTNGDELKSEGTKPVPDDTSLDEATDVSFNSDRKPREGQAGIEENTNSLDNAAILSELSEDTRIGLNANASECIERTELGCQVRVTGIDATRKDPADKRKTTLPILKTSIPDASGRKKSSPKSIYSTPMGVGSPKKITKSMGRNDKQKNTSNAFDDTKKSDPYETKYKLGSEEIIQQGDVMQASSRSSDEAILTSDPESDRKPIADTRITVENDNTLKSNDGDFESCLAPTEKQRSSLKNSNYSENGKNPVTDVASNGCSLTKTDPDLTQDTSGSASCEHEDGKLHADKQVNDEKVKSKLHLNQANSNVDDFNESSLENASQKTTCTLSDAQLTLPTTSFDSNDNDPAEMKDKNPDDRRISQDQERPHPKSVGRTVSICDSVSLISEDDGNDAIAKRKSLARSRSVGFRDPEIIPDTVRPTKTRVTLASASVKDPPKPTSADGRTKIPLTYRKSCPQVVPNKISSLKEDKSPLTPKETPNKTPSKPAPRPALIRSKTVQEPATRRRSATTPQATSSLDHSRISNAPSALKTASISKVTRKKADSDTTLKKPCSKSMESTPRCSCRQKSGSSLARSLSTTDPVKHETLSNQKLCRSLSHASHDDNNPVE